MQINALFLIILGGHNTSGITEWIDLRFYKFGSEFLFNRPDGVGIGLSQSVVQRMKYLMGNT